MKEKDNMISIKNDSFHNLQSLIIVISAKKPFCLSYEIHINPFVTNNNSVFTISLQMYLINNLQGEGSGAGQHNKPDT